MPRINLRNMLSPRSDAFALVTALISEVGAGMFVEDQHRQVLIGEQIAKGEYAEPIMNEEKVIGWVKGHPKASLIAALINGWVSKELEKKKLATEVLVLYQEVNLM